MPLSLFAIVCGVLLAIACFVESLSIWRSSKEDL